MTLSIDQSLNKTAYIIFNDNNQIVEFGVIKIPSSVFDYEDKIVFIGEFISNLIYKHRVDVVKMEEMAYGANSISVRPLAGLYYYLLIIFKQLKLKVIKLAPTTIKKQATGNGKASKEDMINALPPAIFTLFSKGYKKTTGLDDLADAYHIYFSNKA